MTKDEKESLYCRLRVCLEAISNSAGLASGCLGEDDFFDAEPEFALPEIRIINSQVAEALILCTRLIAEKEASND